MLKMEYNIIKNEKGKEIAMVELQGRLDALQSDKIEDELLNLVQEGYGNLIVDMKQVNYLGSSAIRILLALNNKLTKIEGNLKIVGMPDTGIKILKTMEIIDRFELYPNKEEAIEGI